MRPKANLLHGIKCIHCDWCHINKSGFTKFGTQRFICLDCNKSFTMNGERQSYNTKFKEQVIQWHTVNWMWVRQCCKQHHISTQTFYRRLQESYDLKKTI